MPRDAVAPLVGKLDDAPIRIVPRGTEALDLLLVYGSAIADARRFRTPQLRRLAVTHIHDLIAATVGATRDGLAIAEGRGIRAARLRAIMADIAANLDDCELGAVVVAQRQHVTPRYIHRLFESEGLTFSAFVIDQRLSRAHRILSDPQLGDRSISSIAFDVGFGDLSYFNRVSAGATTRRPPRSGKRQNGAICPADHGVPAIAAFEHSFVHRRAVNPVLFTLQEAPPSQTENARSVVEQLVHGELSWDDLLL